MSCCQFGQQTLPFPLSRDEDVLLHTPFVIIDSLGKHSQFLAKGATLKLLFWCAVSHRGSNTRAVTQQVHLFTRDINLPPSEPPRCHSAVRRKGRTLFRWPGFRSEPLSALPLPHWGCEIVALFMYFTKYFIPQDVTIPRNANLRSWNCWSK